MPRYRFSTLLSLPALLLAGFVLASPGATAASAPADRATVLETKMALRDLWVEHVFWIRSYALATHAHDTAQSQSGQQQAIASITSNAREIAKFLSGANPNLPEETVFGLLSSHGGHHVAQINQIATGDFQAEATTWHAMRKHMLVISDDIADALAKQFPTRFQERS